MKILSVLLMLSAVLSKPHERNETEPISTEQLAYYIQGMRGFWVGFNEGLYNRKTEFVTDLCLSRDVAIQMASLMADTESQDVFAIVDFFIQINAVIANIEECGVEQAAEDVELYCTIFECGAEKMLEVLTSKAFQLINEVNVLVETANEFPGEEPEDAFAMVADSGKAMGTIIRLLLGINKL
jgi:hypothetical protein